MCIYPPITLHRALCRRPARPYYIAANAKRKEPDAAEQLLAAYPKTWDGSVAVIASLVRAIDNLGSALITASASGAAGTSSTGQTAAPGAAPRASTTGADTGSPSPGGAPRSSAALAAAAAASAAQAAAGAGYRQAAALLAKRLEVVIAGACVPDCQRRIVQAAVREQLVGVAAALPGALAEARSAVAATAGHGKHAAKHAAGAEAAAASAAAAARAMLVDMVEGLEEGMEKRRRLVAQLLEERTAAVEQRLAAAAAAAQAVDAHGTDRTGLLQEAEGLAWTAHTIQRARVWLQL